MGENSTIKTNVFLKNFKNIYPITFEANECSFPQSTFSDFWAIVFFTSNEITFQWFFLLVCLVKRGNNSGICRSRYSNFQVSFCFGFKWSEAKNWKMNWYLVENAFVTKNSCLILCTLVISFALHNHCPIATYLVSTKTSTYFSPLIFQIWCIISSWWSLWANFYHPLVVYVSTASCCKSQVYGYLYCHTLWGQKCNVIRKRIYAKFEEW